MRSVLIISSHFPPDRGPGTHRVLRFAKHLSGAGWRVSVLTMDPAYYPSGTQVDPRLLEDLPGAVRVYRTRVLRGMAALIRVRNRMMRRTSGSGVRAATTVTVAPGRRSRGQGVKDLITDLFSIPDRDIGWFSYAVREGTRAIRENDVEVLLSSGPPFTCHVIAAALKRRTSVPWAADFRDPWARSPWGQKARRRQWKRRVQGWLEGRAVGLADAVILNTEAMRAEFAAHYGPTLAAKFHTVTNGYDLEVVGSFVGARRAASDTLLVAHAGTLYRERDPATLLRALAAVTSRGEVPPDGIRLHFVGGVSAHFHVLDLLRELRLEAVVRLTPPVSHRESLAALAAADVLLVLQPGTGLQVPVKLYEYMAFRKPMLALAEPGAVADIVQAGRLGFVVEPDDQAAIERALSRLYRERHHLAQLFPVDPAFIAEYDGRRLAARMQAILAATAGRSANGAAR